VPPPSAFSLEPNRGKFWTVSSDRGRRRPTQRQPPPHPRLPCSRRPTRAERARQQRTRRAEMSYAPPAVLAGHPDLASAPVHGVPIVSPLDPALSALNMNNGGYAAQVAQVSCRRYDARGARARRVAARSRLSCRNRMLTPTRQGYPHYAPLGPDPSQYAPPPPDIYAPAGPQGDPFAEAQAMLAPSPSPVKQVKRKRNFKYGMDCITCSKPEAENQEGQPEAFVRCAECGRSGEPFRVPSAAPIDARAAHPSCLKLDGNSEVVFEYAWLCPDCKRCEGCGKARAVRHDVPPLCSPLIRHSSRT
jgi:hypothetical protein